MTKDVVIQMDESVRNKEQGNVANLEIKKGTNSFLIPSPKTNKRSTEKTVTLQNTRCPTKRFIFDLLIVAFNVALYSGKAKTTWHKTIYSTIPRFVDWLNLYKVNVPMKLIIDYRDDRINTGRIKPSNAITSLSTILNTIVPQEERNILTFSQRQILDVWVKTKTAKSEHKQITLTTYFQELAWLRSDELGVGNRLFTQLASPSQVIRSIKLSSGLIMNALHQAKLDSLVLLKSIGVTLKTLPITDWTLSKDSAKSTFNTLLSLSIANLCHQLISYYHDKLNVDEQNNYKLSLSIILTSFCRPKAQIKIIECLDSRVLFDEIWLKKNWFNKNKTIMCFANDSRYGLLNIDALKQLLIADKYNKKHPHLDMEKQCFTWIMASMTVQPSDIFKLTRSDFKLIKSNPRRPVTIIECNYFKGRANKFHDIAAISVKTPEGEGCLRLIEGVSDSELPILEGFDYKERLPHIIGHEQGSLLSGYRLLHNIDMLTTEIIKNHINENISSSFYQVTNTLLNKGRTLNSFQTEAMSISGVKSAERDIWILVAKELWKKSPVKISEKLFGISHIKNSAVHAGSDPIDVDKLINYRSHSGKTEKNSYLNEYNERWRNNTGRITRSVMHDLIQNVFNPSDNVIFNSEFSRVIENINVEFSLVTSRMEIITEQIGTINEVGIMKSKKINKDGIPTILVCDNTETAFKILSYEQMAQQNARKLLRSNADHFFQTVLPNLEIIEHIKRRLSKNSLNQGLKYLKQYHTLDLKH